MSDDSDRFNELTEAFRDETGIWPPGRSMPAAMCGGAEDYESTRTRAWNYWNKARRQLAAANETIGRLGEDSCAAYAAFGVAMREKDDRLAAANAVVAVAAKILLCFPDDDDAHEFNIPGYIIEELREAARKNQPDPK